MDEKKNENRREKDVFTPFWFPIASSLIATNVFEHRLRPELFDPQLNNYERCYGYHRIKDKSEMKKFSWRAGIAGWLTTGGFKRGHKKNARRGAKRLYIGL